MTKALYLENSYIREFEARVVSIDSNKIVLDKTAFYPESGGQQGDLRYRSMRMHTAAHLLSALCDILSAKQAEQAEHAFCFIVCKILLTDFIFMFIKKDCRDCRNSSYS